MFILQYHYENNEGYKTVMNSGVVGKTPVWSEKSGGAKGKKPINSGMAGESPIWLKSSSG